MVTIIIPTCINTEGLKRCISSIVETTHQEYTLIVVKNNYRGFAYAVNSGIRQALPYEKEGFVILNDDIRLFDGWLEAFQEVAKIPEAGVIGGKGMIRDGNHIPFYFTYIKKELIEKIGFLDERFEMGEWEDVDFCVRAIDAGFKIAETNSYHVFHDVSKTLSTLTVEQQARRKLNKMKFKEKWRDTRWDLW